MRAIPGILQTPIAARPVAALRVAAGATALLVVAYAYVDGIGHGRANPFDSFGYFTNLTSMLTGALLILSGIRGLRHRPMSKRLATARAAATACMLVVATVYNGLVPGTGSAPPWVSAVLHAALPGYVALDWLLVGDRPALPWSSLWVVLPYPLVWISVVLVRGATDGWVPYGFLLPAHGALSLGMHLAGLLLLLLVAGTAVWACSRLPGAPRAITRG